MQLVQPVRNWLPIPAKWKFERVVNSLLFLFLLCAIVFGGCGLCGGAVLFEQLLLSLACGGRKAPLNILFRIIKDWDEMLDESRR